MFNDTSIIKEVNILNKVICYLLVILILIICKDNLYIILSNIFLLLITKQYIKLFKFNIIVTFLILLNLFFPHFLWIIKLCVLIIYTILLSKVTKLSELRYVIEVTLYRFKNKKITYKLFYSIYFIKNFKKYIKRMIILKDDYSIPLSFKFIIFILKQAYIKAKNDKKDFIIINNKRFYNISSNRTYIDKIRWESWDTNYLICHIVILIITFFYGR